MLRADGFVRGKGGPYRIPVDFTIISPSFRQLDWLECCLASVADQVVWEGEQVGKGEGAGNGKTITVEHIVQDAGSPGIEAFAEQTGRRLQATHGGEKLPASTPTELLHFKTAGYSLRIYREPDAGMYDAVNRGLRKGTGGICGYLNCDEQYLFGSLRRVGAFFQQYPQIEVMTADTLVVDRQGNLICGRKNILPRRSHILASHLAQFTCSLFFRRTLLDSPIGYFDSRFRDCADALWFVQNLAARRRFGHLTFYSSTFMDTGENMNLKPNARAEARLLAESAPWWIRWGRPLLCWGHRLWRWVRGAYRARPVAYDLYLSPAGKRVRRECLRPAMTWRSRW